MGRAVLSRNNEEAGGADNFGFSGLGGVVVCRSQRRVM
jgi:hypothetical protein